MLMASIHGGKSSHWKQFALNQWSAWDQDTSEAALRQRRHLEDELTSIVLGPLRYMSAPQTLQFWQRVFEVSANRRLAPDFQADRQSVTFWPSYKTDSGRVEPDAHFLFSSSATAEKQEESSFEILLEVKWQSPLSGEGQLRRQWKHFPGVDGKKNALHVLLVIDGARWRQHVLHERRERHASQLSVISWADIQYAASTLRDSGDALGNYAGDIDDYLQKIGFLGIKGFEEFAEPEIFFELSGSNCIFWRGKQYWTWVSDYLFEEQNMSQDKINQNIINAFRVTDQCWSEALNIKNILVQLLNAKLNDLDNEHYQIMGKKQEEIFYSDNGQMKNGVQVVFPMCGTGRGRKKPTACVIFAICFAKPGVSPEHESPTLHVGFWGYDVEVGAETVGFDFEDADNPSLIDGRLFSWGDVGSLDGWEFNYALHLTAMTDQKTLEKCVVQPLVDLMSGVPVMKALPDDLPGLMKFSDVNVLCAYAEEGSGVARSRVQQSSTEDESEASEGESLK